MGSIYQLLIFILFCTSCGSIAGRQHVLTSFRDAAQHNTESDFHVSKRTLTKASQNRVDPKQQPIEIPPADVSTPETPIELESADPQILPRTNQAITDDNSHLAKSAKAGFEFTFTNDQLVQAYQQAMWKLDPSADFLDVPIVEGVLRPWATEEQVQAKDQFLRRLKESCQNCQIETSYDKYGHIRHHVINPDLAWGFAITIDPTVIEVITDLATLEQFRNMETFIQSVIFDSARHAGLAPRLGHGEGHLSLNLSTTFGYDIHFLRNFTTDLANNVVIPSVFWNSKPGYALDWT